MMAAIDLLTEPLPSAHAAAIKRARAVQEAVGEALAAGWRAEDVRRCVIEDSLPWPADARSPVGLMLTRLRQLGTPPRARDDRDDAGVCSSPDVPVQADETATLAAQDVTLLMDTAPPEIRAAVRCQLEQLLPAMVHQRLDHPTWWRTGGPMIVAALQSVLRPGTGGDADG